MSDDAPGSDDDAPGGDDDARRPRHVGRTIAIALAGLVLPVIGVVLLVRSCSRSAVSGEVAISGAGGWRQQLNRCRSGELHSYLGVELGREVDGKWLVRATLDPDRGTIIELTPPAGGAPTVLAETTCPGLRVEVRKVGTDGDGAALLDGRAVARCTLPDGRTVQLDAWWRRCGP